MLARRCSAKGSARNRDENRVHVDTDRSFVSIHPPWHLTSTPRTMSTYSSPLRSVAPRCPADQPNMQIQTILICLIACHTFFPSLFLIIFQGFLRNSR